MDHAKIAAMTIDSPVWQMPDTTKIVWVTMLAMADRRGIVESSIPNLAAHSRVDIERCVDAIEHLMTANEWNVSAGNDDGRCVARADNGWRIVDYGKYRQLLAKAARNEYQRVLMAKRRAASKSADAATASDLHC